MGSNPIGISASRGASVLGESPYESQFEIWQIIQEQREPGFNEARGFKLPEFKENAFIRFGRAFEDSIIDLAEKKYNVNPIRMREKFFTHKKYKFITAHIDGAYLKPKKRKIKYLHEGKTTFDWVFKTKWGNPGSDIIPIEYFIQGQHQMLCTGADYVIFSVLVFPKSAIDWENEDIQIYYNNSNYYLKLGFEKDFHFVDCKVWARYLNQMGFFHQFTIKRDDRIIEGMLDAYNDFWHDNILEKKEPEGKTYEDLKRIITNPFGSIIINEKIEDMIYEYKDINKELSKSGIMAKRKEQLKALILDESRKLDKVLDDESKSKIIFYNQKGDKMAAYGINKNGSTYFK